MQEVGFGSEVDGELFVESPERTRLTWNQKRFGKRQHRENQSGREQGEPNQYPLDLTTDELQKLQEEDGVWHLKSALSRGMG